MQPNANAQPYIMVGSNATAIAAGATTTFNISNNSIGDFYVRRIKAIPRLSAQGTAALAGTPLPLESNANDVANSNTMPPATLVTLNIKVGTNQLFSGNISVAALMGAEGEGFWFADVLPMIATRQEAQVTVTNGTASGINIEISMPGFAVPPGQSAFAE